MTVWLIFPLFPPYAGGSASQAEALVKGLEKESSIHRVFMLTEFHRDTQWHGSAKVWLWRWLPRRESQEKRDTIGWFLTFFITQIIVMGVVVWVSLPWHRNNQIIHIHRRYGKKWFGVGWLGWLLRPRIVVDVQDHAFSPGDLALFWRISYVSKAIGRKLDASRFTVGKKCYYVPPPVDFEKIQVTQPVAPILPAGMEPYILFVGAMTLNKGVMELLTAFQNVAGGGAHFHHVAFLTLGGAGGRRRGGGSSAGLARPRADPALWRPAGGADWPRRR